MEKYSFMSSKPNDNPTITQRIKLRAMEPEDVDAIFAWENDPQIWVYNAAHQPFSRYALEKFIEEQSQSDIYTARQLRLMAENDDGICVGCIDLYDFDPYHKRAAIGVLTDNKMRGKGYGRMMLGALENFAKEHIGIHQLHCAVSTSNTQSIRLFKSAGYTESGVMKEWIYDNGNWVDALVFQKIIH